MGQYLATPVTNKETAAGGLALARSHAGTTAASALLFPTCHMLRLGGHQSPRPVQGAMEGSTTASLRSRAGGRTWWAAGGCLCTALATAAVNRASCLSLTAWEFELLCGACSPCLQEDAHIAEHLNDECHIFGVFDGHGGPEVAKFCSKRMPGELVGCPGFVQGRYEEGLKQVGRHCLRVLGSTRPARAGSWP